MRVIIVGASTLGRGLAEKLIGLGTQVVVVERDGERAEDIAENLDCSVIHGEGTRPDILDKAGIEDADAVVACTDHDQDNILIGLIARGAGVRETILRTDDAQFLVVAKRLGFHHVLNPPQATAEIIADALRGVDTIELSTLVRGDIRFLGVIARGEVVGKRISEVIMPKQSSIVGMYRGQEFLFAAADPAIEEGDEVLVVTAEEHSGEIDALLTTPAPG
ncbi:potassium channel family protein [Methanofollis fontis]|uniref:TrkA family potassium uptake protein n=1 Tax=Methanofollis fontis TaxID=2052832 RepID=A0A483CXT0_9EURY|nr:NAD-binding protein [Methanofollis fontis]TAJ44789.1 TrkA family potassium uptake protein [Methanofollis fontis]